MADRSKRPARRPVRPVARRGRRLRRSRWPGRVGLTLACLLLATGLAYPFLAPYRLRVEMAQQVSSAQNRLDALIDSNRRMEQEIRFLQTDEGVETLARRRGYRRKGEVVYRVHTASSSPDDDRR